jgi:hypothetical protein
MCAGTPESQIQGENLDKVSRGPYFFPAFTPANTWTSVKSLTLRKGQLGCLHKAIFEGKGF